MERISAYCQKWHIAEFSLFGSVLRDDFGPDSDVDVLVTYEAGHTPKRLDDLLTAEEELKQIVGRDVDLVDKQTLIESRNYIRRGIIFDSAKRIYAC